VTPTPNEVRAVAATTRAVYEQNAARFDAERPKGLHERVWLDRFLDVLPARATILDVGCGAGRPIAAYFVEQGHRVTGVDFSLAMLALARERFPAGDWRWADMRTLELGERFDGIIAWNSFFHLTSEDQRGVLARFAAHLRAGGGLMVTVGPSASEDLGRVGDDPIYHASLAPAEYTAILRDLGLAVLRFTPDDPQCDFQSVLLARRVEAGAPLTATPRP